MDLADAKRSTPSRRIKPMLLSALIGALQAHAPQPAADASQHASLKGLRDPAAAGKVIGAQRLSDDAVEAAVRAAAAEQSWPANPKTVRKWTTDTSRRWVKVRLSAVKAKLGSTWQYIRRNPHRLALLAQRGLHLKPLRLNIPVQGGRKRWEMCLVAID